MQPPATRRDDVVDVLHGVPVADPYRWLEDGDSPDTREWVAAQNTRTREALDARPDRDRWLERLVALMDVPICLSASPRGQRLFCLERPAGAAQTRLVERSTVDRDAEVRVLVDPAALSADGAVAIDWYSASPTGARIVYGVSEGGTENSTLKVLDVATGRHLADEIPRCRASSIAWLPDESGCWYARYPADDQYNRRIYLHRFGTDWADDELVWADLPTPETWANVSASSDGRWLLVHAMVGWSRFDLHLCDRTTGEWRTLVDGVDAQTSLDFTDTGLIGVTTLDAPRGRMITASFDAPTSTDWQTLVAEVDGVRGGFEVVGDEVWSIVTDNAVDRVERHALEGGTLIGTLDTGVVSVFALQCDPLLDDPAHVFVGLTGFDTPSSIFRCSDGALTPWAPGGDPSAALPGLAVSHRTYTSYDGTEIGIFLVHRRGLVPTAETPAILNGYGGFAISETPVWGAMTAAWCEAGGLFAMVGLRGGFEHGEDWHQAGRRGNKQNVFDDFHAAGDWLVAEGLTSRDRLAIFGGSNGGLLVGAALTQRPGAYRAVWCAVPLLDMIRFPQFLIARLWTDEYGDPDVAEEFAWLHAYSPYHRVSDGTGYPAVLFTTAEGDTRVDPLHARKMAALLQHAAADQDEHPILLMQEGRAGHGAGKPVAMQAAERADALAFFTWQLGGPAI